MLHFNSDLTCPDCAWSAWSPWHQCYNEHQDCNGTLQKTCICGDKSIHFHVICYVFMSRAVLSRGEKCRNTWKSIPSAQKLENNSSLPIFRRFSPADRNKTSCDVRKTEQNCVAGTVGGANQRPVFCAGVQQGWLSSSSSLLCSPRSQAPSSAASLLRWQLLIE